MEWLKKHLSTIGIGLLYFFILFTPLLYMYGYVFKTIPYNVVLLLGTVVIICMSFVVDNEISRDFFPYLSGKKFMIGLGVICFGLFIIQFIWPDNSRIFNAIILSLHVFCSMCAVTFGGYTRNTIYKYVIIFSSLLFSAIVWIILSYGSYYNGVQSGASQASLMFINTVESILMSEDNDEIIKEKIKDAYGNIAAKKWVKVNISKNGKPYGEEYYPKKREDYDLSKLQTGIIKDKNNNTYVVSYQFHNKPELVGGLARAMLFSVPDTENIDNEFYFSQLNYLRGIHLWWVFWIVYSLSLVGLYFYQKQEESFEELQIAFNDKNVAIREKDLAMLEKDRAYQKQMEALEELEDYKVFFDDTRKQIDDKISESRNTLQIVDSSWSKIAQEANKAVLDGYRGKRHDTFNYFNDKLKTWGKEDFLAEINKPGYKEKLENYMGDIQAIDQTYYKEKGNGQSFLSETYGVILGPWLLRIRNDLQNLDDIFDLTPSNITVDRIVTGITSEETIKKVKCNVSISNDINREAECCIIPDKLQSMVYNLLENSSQAGDRYHDELYEKDKKLARGFKTNINLILKEIERDCKKYLSIEVQDNCGGFPPEIENIVYIDKVKSSKATNVDHGNGTYLIGRFAKRMGIIVQHNNIMLEDGQKGAQTTLLVPYV